MKKLTLLILLFLGLTSISSASYLDDWTDDQICGWMESPTPPEYIIEEAVKRNLDCAPESAKKKAQEDTGLQIMIYDADFSDSDLDEFSQNDLNKTDFDFSEFKIVKNHRNLECEFYIREVMYDDTGPWQIAEGSLVIDSGEVKINAGSRWRRGGLSTDPKYLRDEVNLRLTEDGYLVGKMAYFEWVGDGELPKSPIYPSLLKHKKSIPLNSNNSSAGSAKFWLEKTLDWSDGVLHLSNCAMYEESYKDGKLEGKNTSWYPNGEIKSEISYKDGDREGKSTFWYPNGEIKSEISYKDGEKEGKSTAWYQSGQKISEVDYKNGKKEGKYINWFENSQKRGVENYLDGKRKGKSSFWYQNGQLKSVVHYKNNYKEGKETSWYENGQLKSEINYINGGGKETSWYQDGQIKSESNYKNHNREGKQTTWYKNGQLKSEVHYKNNYKEGKETFWYQNGQIKSEANYKYEKGEVFGRDGSLKSKANFHDNKITGNAWKWFSNGQMQVEAPFINGVPNGKMRVWYENGQLKAELNYKEGNFDGNSTSWNSDGSIKQERVYKDGVCISGDC